MKTSSWEIVVAGLLFLGAGIYIFNQKTESASNSVELSSVDSLVVQLPDKNFKIIELKNFENLENLENLKNLRNLKNLSNFLPVEVRTEFESEIEAALEEFGEQEVDIQINKQDSIISINAKSAGKNKGWNVVSPGVFSYTKEFERTAVNTANLDLAFGSIEVIGSSNQPAKIVIKASGDVSNPGELQSKLDVQSDFSNKTFSFQLNPRQSFRHAANIHLEATLHVPENIALNTKTKGGHISAENITGTQDYSTGGGHIRLNSLNGKIHAKTSGGHIFLKNGKGDIALTSAGGNIRAEETTGQLSMKTNGGNLQAIYPNGALNASTNAGNVEVQFEIISEDVNVSTGAGVISFIFEHDVHGNFNLSGSSIDIDPELNFSGNIKDGKATGIIGEDGKTVSAKTNYGKINLKKSN